MQTLCLHKFRSNCLEKAFKSPLLDDNVVFYALKELVAYALNLLDFLDRSEVVVLAVINDCLCLAFAYAFERFKLLDACGVDIDNPKQKPSAHAQECKNFFHRISFKILMMVFYYKKIKFWFKKAEFLC